MLGASKVGRDELLAALQGVRGSHKVTVARWITPAGRWIIGNGIEPDITVGYTKSDDSAKPDSQVARAVEFLTTGK